MGQSSSTFGKPSGQASLLAASCITIASIVSLMLFTGASFTYVSFDMLENDGSLSVVDWQGDNSDGHAPVWAMIMLWTSFLLTLVGTALFLCYYHLAHREKQSTSRCCSSIMSLIVFVLAGVVSLVTMGWFIYLYVQSPAPSQVDLDYYLIQMALSIIAGIFVVGSAIVLGVGIGCCFGADNEGYGNSRGVKTSKSRSSHRSTTLVSSSDYKRVAKHQ
jgi:hypothetical protein